MIHVNQTTHVRSSPPENTLLSRLFERASRLTTRLARHVAARKVSHAPFDEVEDALATLPLSSEEFSVACCRLRNARQAMFAGEFGAAGFELRLLAHSLHAMQRR